jgi:hypothetical protein
VALAISVAGTACFEGACSDERVVALGSPSELPKPPDPYDGSPSRFGEVPLHAGFSPDPRVVAGEARGEIEARSIHRKCRGWISEVPDYLLTSSSAFFKLYVLGRSRADVSLVVRKPDGTVLCNDDRRGSQDPVVRSSFSIGTSQIWVGVKEEGTTARYRLGFSEVSWQPSSIPLPDSI